MLIYNYYKVKSFARRKMIRIFPSLEKKIRYFAKRKIIKGIDTQRMIHDWIESGVPFMIARFGSVELRCTAESEIYSKRKEKAFCNKTWKSMGNNAGLFPVTESNLVKFADIMKKSCENVDLLGAWFMPMEDYMLNQYMRKTKLTRLWSLEPYRFPNPWTSALKGKRVLVIHPFADTILKQYARRKEVWGEQELLPDFDIQVIRAVQTAAGERDERFRDWFEALEYMKEEIRLREFDLAIIGCGAYGFPLAAYVKDLGKQAIHLGGATQLLFGIKGKRWEDHDPVVSSFFNEYWVRPSKQESPENRNTIEGGCYW